MIQESHVPLPLTLSSQPYKEKQPSKGVVFWASGESAAAWEAWPPESSGWVCEVGDQITSEESGLRALLS